ncbi:MAG: cyclic pyranopterin phosphate synthase [Glaciecola sp.]|jgi:cyclic pyranopterin phosphate synthase|uniref:GTP 3',8-cyclase MoaA n=1 Tax=Congregibacter sp. TaxID=2744308 RepID=UPI0039E57891
MDKKTPQTLIDRFGRRVDYLRLSVTDRCDFRCVYCMAEEMKFVPKSEVLTLEELAKVAQAFVNLGVRKIRLTGGEPLVRHNIMQLVEQLGAMPGLDELVMTTNGSQLQRLAQPLSDAGVKRLNISLDSLQPRRFRQITRVGHLEQVVAGIDAACLAGFERLRINAVIMRGDNDDEVLDLVNFARERDIDLAFIEEMPLGRIEDHDRAQTLANSDWLRAQIEQHHSLEPLGEPDGTDGPARMYALDGSRSRIGFISPHSNNFCHLCNRVRVTVEGQLLLCLGNEHSVDLRELLRSPDTGMAELQETLLRAMDIKPERHYFDNSAEPQILRFMNATGG